jgi:hypothetical protein
VICGDHVAQRVVERPQIRGDLFLHVTRKKAQTFAGLDGRTGKDNPGDIFSFEGSHGRGNREVGLPRSCGPDAHDDVIAFDGGDIPELGFGAGPNQTLAGGQHRLGEIVTASDFGGCQLSSVRQTLSPEAGDHFLYQGRDVMDLLRRTGDPQRIASCGEANAVAPFERNQIGVVMSVKREEIYALD